MISAAKHFHKDEGFFEKTFILEIMFEYYFIEKHTICQGPAGKSRLILTVMELRRRFGEDSIFNCCLMTEEKIPHGKNEVAVLPSPMFK